MIRRDSTLELRRVPLALVYPASLHNSIGADNPTLRYFIQVLEDGYDLSPVLMRTGPGVVPGMFRLEDGRKRWIAHLIVARADILSVVEERPAD